MTSAPSLAMEGVAFPSKFLGTFSLSVSEEENTWVKNDQRASDRNEEADDDQDGECRSFRRRGNSVSPPLADSRRSISITEPNLDGPSRESPIGRPSGSLERNYDTDDENPWEKIQLSILDDHCLLAERRAARSLGEGSPQKEGGSVWKSRVSESIPISCTPPRRRSLDAASEGDAKARDAPVRQSASVGGSDPWESRNFYTPAVVFFTVQPRSPSLSPAFMSRFTAALSVAREATSRAGNSSFVTLRVTSFSIAARGTRRRPSTWKRLRRRLRWRLFPAPLDESVYQQQRRRRVQMELMANRRLISTDNEGGGSRGTTTKMTLFPRSRPADYPLAGQFSTKARDDDDVETRDIVLEISFRDILFVFSDLRDSRIFCVVALRQRTSTDAKCYIFKAPTRDQRSVIMDRVRSAAEPTNRKSPESVDDVPDGTRARDRGNAEKVAASSSPQEAKDLTSTSCSSSVRARALEERLARLEIVVEEEKCERAKMEERLARAIRGYESLRLEHESFKRSLISSSASNTSSIDAESRQRRVEGTFSPSEIETSRGDDVVGPLSIEEEESLWLQSPDSGHGGDASYSDSDSSSAAGDERHSSSDYSTLEREKRSGGGRKVRFGHDVQIHVDEAKKEDGEESEVVGGVVAIRPCCRVSRREEAETSCDESNVVDSIPSLSSSSSSSPSLADSDYADFLSPLLFAASRERGRAYSAKKLRQYDAKLFCRDLSTVYSSQSQACFNYYWWTRKEDER